MKFSKCISHYALYGIFVSVLFFSDLHAQDTTTWFPVSIGNYWEYFGRKYSGSWWYWSYSYTVTGDTLLANGKTYTKIVPNLILGTQMPDTLYFREENKKIYQYFDNSLVCPEAEFVYYDFSEADSLAWPVCVNYSFEDLYRVSVSGFTFYDIFSKTLETRKVGYWQMLNGSLTLILFGVPVLESIVAKEVGITSQFHPWFGEMKLTRAVIDGVTYGQITTSINEYEFEPMHYSLSQNYPNPFNPDTKITWHVPAASHILIEIFDILGNKIETLVNDFVSAGLSEITWNASGNTGGVYFCKMTCGTFAAVKKMVLLK